MAVAFAVEGSVSEPAPEDDPRVAAAKIVAASNYAIAASIKEAAETLQPVADAVSSLSDAQKKFCSFIVQHRLKILASVPVVLTTIGAISPNLAKVLHDALLVLGAHP